MTEKYDKRENANEEPIEFDFGFGNAQVGGLWNSFVRLLELTQQQNDSGGDVRKQGQFKIKGINDLKGVYGISVRCGIGDDGGERTIVQPFGNIKKTPRGPVIEDTREPLIDLFEDGGLFQVVAEMPGVAEDDIRYELRDGVLILEAVGERKYRKEVQLPGVMDASSIRKRYRNGVLELTFGAAPENPDGGSS